MIKLAFAAAALVAVGTTAIVAHPWSKTTTTNAAVTASAPIAAPLAAPVAKTPPPFHQPALVMPKAAELPPGAVKVPSPDEMPVLDRAARAHAHLDRGPSRGPTTAPVTIVVFTDMVCPHCGNALGTIDQLWDEYPSKLRLVVKEMPVHKSAELAAEAAFAADAQGKFWELHDLMLAHQDDLSRDALLALAPQIGLDVATFRTALDTHQYKPSVAADMASAAELELTGTPSFVINGRRVIGNYPIAELRAIIDEALANP